MTIFKSDNGKLTQIKERPIKLEKDLQSITENNLGEIFGIDFIDSEFSLQQFRIDTLAFDDELKSFVIIEYKRDRSFSVIDQGYAYLALMLNNKADFILKYNEKKHQNLKKEDVDWTQSKVLFLANSFTEYQQNAINFRDLPIELWEVRKYDQQIFSYNQLKPSATNESINVISKNKLIKNVSNEVRTYSIDDHFKNDWKKSREIFDNLRQKIIEIDPRIKEIATKQYIGYKINNKVIVGLKIQKGKIIVVLNRVRPDDLEDYKGVVKYVNNSMKYWGKHVSNYDIRSQEDVDYATYLIKQVYNKFYK